MPQLIDRQMILRLHRQLTTSLQKWENDPAAEASGLRATAAQVKEQLAAWESAGAYVSTEQRLLSDAVEHAHVRLSMAQQEARGY